MNERPVDVAELRTEMNLSRHEIEQRKAWLGLDDDDAKRLGQIDDLVAPYVGAAVDALTEKLVVDEDAYSGTHEQLRRLLREYFGGLTGGNDLDDGFVDQRLRVLTALRENLGSDVSWYLAAYLLYLNQVGERMRESSGDPEVMPALHWSLAKTLFLDLSLAIDVYVYERDRTIRAQQRELEELSTPVLQLREGLLILPIVGVLDSRRAQQLTEQLLMAIRDRRGKVVVLDVTGVAAVDSRVANHLIQTVDAARLMGAKAIVTGVSPEVAQTLVGLGISLGNVTTVAELQGGVEEADRLLGLRVVPVDGLPAESGQR